ncbi:MAG: amidohydrolase [Neisseriaceae bacterium]|nr:amidohydrolase [Neisseriaceae bacterium]
MHSNKIVQAMAQWQPQAVALRRALHAHPELGFEELQTQSLIVATLQSYGVSEINVDFAQTAVVAVIDGALGPGPSIGLRADMDALPITEANEFAHRSTQAGKMHACGHDGHTSMLLMAARYLSQNRGFKGRVVLIFQPAEEGLGGAGKMLAEGVLAAYPIDACYALHNMPGLPVGHFAFKRGSIMASSDRLFITVTGQSGHAGQPHRARDPLLVATHIYQAIQGMVSREFDPLAPVVVSITQIHGGETNNVIGAEAKLSGTFRTHSHEVRRAVIEKLERIVTHTAAAFGMSAEFTLGPVSHPPTVNTDAEYAMAVAAATRVVGAEAVDVACAAYMTSEDFALFLEQVPGCYGLIGNGETEAHCSIGLHNKHYDFNDDIMPIGAAFFVAVVEGHQ